MTVRSDATLDHRVLKSKSFGRFHCEISGRCIRLRANIPELKKACTAKEPTVSVAVYGRGNTSFFYFSGWQEKHDVWKLGVGREVCSANSNAGQINQV